MGVLKGSQYDGRADLLDAPLTTYPDAFWCMTPSEYALASANRSPHQQFSRKKHGIPFAYVVVYELVSISHPTSQLSSKGLIS
ncbi:MAG: phage tail assembly chaperone [Burkholderiaceae bacterium]